MKKNYKITVIGAGYVGLVSGAVFADWGNDVTCLDISEDKINKLNQGIMPIYEEGLEELVAKVKAEGRFRATTDYKMAVEHGEIIFICVGTPSNQSGAADLRYVFDVATKLGQLIPENAYKVVVTKSTVPVGTNRRVGDRIRQSSESESRQILFDIVSNPEFLREGTSIYDAQNPDRIIIGSDSETALKVLEDLYAHLNSPIIKSDLESAELIKYASNAFLATKIAFINEISQVCERTGADVKAVAHGMGMDNRIGPKFLNASIGYGGSCFPKDVEALYRTSSENLYDFRLLRGVMDANSRQRYYFLEKIFNKYGENLNGLNIGVLGAAFKNGTDDVRKSPAIEIIRVLKGAGASLKLYDPAAMETSKIELGDTYLEYCNSGDQVFDGVDCVVILTEWKEFSEYDYSKLLGSMKSKVVFDGRNLLDPLIMRGLGCEYHAIGRK